MDERDHEDLGELTPSKIQGFVSELFRLQLCRNDDYNLASSVVVKNLASTSSGMNKVKIIGDIKGREDDRKQRENQIMEGLLGFDFEMISTNKHLKNHVHKFCKKMLNLSQNDAHHNKLLK